MTARIYRPARTAMQSGQGKSKQWLLVHELAESKAIDPLMGYTTSGDTRQQVRLSFETQEDAEAYEVLTRSMFIEAALIVNHSPYAEVRAVVSNKDDPSMPSSTMTN